MEESDNLSLLSPSSMSISILGQSNESIALRTAVSTPSSLPKTPVSNLQLSETISSPLHGEVISPLAQQHRVSNIGIKGCNTAKSSTDGPESLISSFSVTKSTSNRDYDTEHWNAVNNTVISSSSSLYQHESDDDYHECPELEDYGLLPWLPPVCDNSALIVSETKSCSVEQLHGFVSAMDFAKEKEAKSLADLLYLFKSGKLSQRRICQALRTTAVQSTFSYRVIMDYIRSRTAIEPQFFFMCKEGHAPLSLSGSQMMKCPAKGCNLSVSTDYKFWFCRISEVLAALCNEPESFSEIINDCEEIIRSLHEKGFDRMYNYYDGQLFRRKYGAKMRKMDRSKELYIFLTLSSDGFEVFKFRKRSRSSWPVAVMILNLDRKHRFRASNAIISAFIPGGHDPDCFDMFLDPVITDLARLEQGIPVTCVDGKTRVIRGFVLFFTSDWPAGTKILGFSGQNSVKPCRFCYKVAAWVPEANGMYLVPDVDNECHLNIEKYFQDHPEYTAWIRNECKQARKDKETRKVWVEIEDIGKESDRGWVSRMKSLIRSTGIKRRPVLSKLSIHIVRSAPYDPMHCVLLGWVKLLLTLCIGCHPRRKKRRLSYAIDDSIFEGMNACLENAAIGIRAEWGRVPLSLERLSEYKAEDFKNFALFYGAALFSSEVGKPITELWFLTGKIVHVVLNPTPKRSDICVLRQLVQEAHKAHMRFSEVFYIDDSHAYCFTPTTHAILHLPEMLEDCGPLTNVSQFIVERMVGEVGALVKSPLRPDANMFKKNFTLLSIRLILGGLERNNTNDGVSGRGQVDDNESSEDDRVDDLYDENTAVSQSPDNVELLGVGKVISGTRRYELALEFVKNALPITTSDVVVRTIKGHRGAKLGEAGACFRVETVEQLLKSSKASGLNVRQKCWVAGHFVSEDATTSSILSSGGKFDVHYGSIKEIRKLD